MFRAACFLHAWAALAVRSLFSELRGEAELQLGLFSELFLVVVGLPAAIFVRGRQTGGQRRKYKLKMPKSCSAYNCTNRYNSKNPELTFHRFPLSKPHLLQEWLENIGRADFCPKRHMVICSQHFTPESFSSYGNRKNLTWNAVPTLFNATQGQPKVRRYGKLLKQLKNDPDPSPVTPATPVAPAGEESRQCSRCQGAEPVKMEQDRSQPPHTQCPPEPVSREHSYALSDLRVMKAQFFGALESNAKLRKRLKVKVEIIRRTKLKLRAANRELERLRAANRSAAGADPV